MRDDLFITIIRFKQSYDFLIDKNYKYVGNGSKVNPFTSKDFDNNIKNNCIDTILLTKGKDELFFCDKLQTVANYPGADVLDTVKEGLFKIRCFVKPGISFADPNDTNRIKIHGIINALDEENQIIDNNSYQNDNGVPKGRWLVHSTYFPKKNIDLLYAWSLGCFIFQNTNLLNLFNSTLIIEKVNPGDIIPIQLKEI